MKRQSRLAGMMVLAAALVATLAGGAAAQGGGGGGGGGMKCVNVNLSPELALNGVFAQGSGTVCFSLTTTDRSLSLKGSHINAPDGALVRVRINSSADPATWYTFGNWTVNNQQFEVSFSTLNGYNLPPLGGVGSMFVDVAPDSVNFVTILGGGWKSGP